MIVRGTAREELRSAIAALPSDMAAKWPRTLTAPLDPGHGIVDGAGPVFAEADLASFQTHLTPPRFAKTPSAFPGHRAERFVEIVPYLFNENSRTTGQPTESSQRG
jgi:hypothetical protein